MLAVKVVLGTAPITVSFFSPFLNSMTVGMLLMPYSVAIRGLSSVLSLKHLIFPEYCFASSSIKGSIIRQGPHHGAQKSTSTGISLSKTRLFHVPSLTSLTWATVSCASQTTLLKPRVLFSLLETDWPLLSWPSILNPLHEGRWYKFFLLKLLLPRRTDARATELDVQKERLEVVRGEDIPTVSSTQAITDQTVDN